MIEHGSSAGAAAGRSAEADGMASALFAFRVFARFGLSVARPTWPRRWTVSACSKPIRDEENRGHASGLDRGALKAKPSLDTPNQNRRIICILFEDGSTRPPATAHCRGGDRGHPNGVSARNRRFWAGRAAEEETPILGAAARTNKMAQMVWTVEKKRENFRADAPA